MLLQGIGGRRGGEVQRGGVADTGVVVACQVFDAARGKLALVIRAVGQICCGVDGQGAAVARWHQHTGVNLTHRVFERPVATRCTGSGQVLGSSHVGLRQLCDGLYKLFTLDPLRHIASIQLNIPL